MANHILAVLLILSAAGTRIVQSAHPRQGNSDSNVVAAVTFIPNGRALAAGGYRNVRIIEATTGRLLARLEGPVGVVTSVQFSPNGAMLAAASGLPARSGEIHLYDAHTWKPLLALNGHDDVIYSIAWSPDSRRIAAGSYDHLVSLWDIGQSAGGRRQEAGGRPHRSRLTRHASRLTPTYLKDHIDSVYSVAFSPDGKYVASAAGDRTVKVWNAATGKRAYTLSESTAELYAVAFSPDGRRIAAGGVDKALRIWNFTPTGGALAKAAFAHDGAILRVAFDRSGKSIYTSGEDGLVKRWDSATLEERKAYPKQPDWPQGIALSPDGRVLAIGRHDGSIALYNAVTGATLTRSPIRARNRLESSSSSSSAVRTVRFHRTIGSPVQAQQEPPRTSRIPGVKPGTKQKRPRQTGGPTLFMASLGNVSPAGASRGGTTRFTLSGGLISDAVGVYFDEPTITAKVVEPRDSNTGILRVDAGIAAAARIGIHRVFVQTPHGTTGSVTFVVGGWPEVAQGEPNDAPDQAQKIVPPCTVVGAMDKPGDVDSFRVEARAGEELVFEVVAQPIRSRLQPVLQLIDSGGRLLAESKTRFGKPDVLMGYRFDRAGSYVLQLRDYEGAGGGDVNYRLNVGEFAIVTDAWPPGVQAGSTTEIAVTGFNLSGQKTTRVTAPAETSWGRIAEFQMQTPAGPLLYPIRLAVGADPETSQQPGNSSVRTAQKVQLPVTINARLNPSDPATQRPNDPAAQFYRFTARKNQSLIIEIMARRLGSPLDSEIEVLDSRGNPVERAVLRAVGKTEMVLNDRDSSTGALRLQAWDDFHMNDFLMVGREVIRILTLPKGPDDDVQFRMLKGQRLGYFGTTPEFHSLGSAVYKVQAHPARSTFSPNGFPLTCLSYRNDDGSSLYGKDSYLEFTAPADGEYIVRVSDARGQSGSDFHYRLSIHEPRPEFQVYMNPPHPNLPKGGAVAVDISCDRYEGFDGPIDVRIEGLPAGFSATSSTIEAGEISTTVLISATADAVTPPARNAQGGIRIVAKWRAAGRELVKTIEPENGIRLVTVMPPPDVQVTTDLREVVIRPGQEVRVQAYVDRQGKFGGRVPINVLNLPSGVRVQNIGLNGILVTEEQESRSFTIYCDPWVKPQVRPIYVFADVEGGIRNAAPPLLLRIEGSAPAARSASASR